MSEHEKNRPVRRRRLVDKLTLVLLLVALAPLAVADIQLFSRLSVMREHIESTLRDFGEHAAAGLLGNSEKEARNLVQETAEQAGQRVDQILRGTALHVQMLSNVLTDIYTHPERYTPLEIKASDPAETGLSAQLMFSPNVHDREALRGNIALAANSQGYLLQLAKTWPALNVITVADAGGFVIDVDRFASMKFENGGLKEFEARIRPWYLSARDKQGLIFTDVYENFYSRRPTIGVAAPFYRNGEFAGVVALSYSLEAINALVQEISFSENGFAFTVNREGRVISSPRVEGELAVAPLGLGPDLRESADPALAEVVRRMLAGESGEAQVVIDGNEHLVAVEPLPSIGWGLGVVQDMDEVMRPSRVLGKALDRLADDSRAYIGDEQRFTLMLLLLWHAVIIGLVVLAARFFARRISRPLGVLSSWAGDISAGRLETPVRLETGDELEDLAGNLDNMRRNLVSHIDELDRTRTERERIQAELDLAREIQSGLLPKLPEGGFPQVDLAGGMLPAKVVGGDFFDFFLLAPDRLAVVLSDAAGKGIPAAMFTTLVKAMIKAELWQDVSPAQALAAVNAGLYQNSESGLFSTAFVGVLNLDDGRLRYANAGHCPPLVSFSGEGFQRLPVRPGLVLGVDPDFVYEDREAQLAPGARLVVYSDGVTEAQDPDDALFGEHRLLALLNNDCPENIAAATIVKTVEKAVFAFAREAEQADDLTLLVLRYRPDGEDGAGGRQTGAGAGEKTWPATQDAFEPFMAFVREGLEQAGYPEAGRVKFLIAAEEIFVNIIHYAYGRPGGEILTGLSVTDARIRLEFRDRGQPFDPTSQTDPQADMPLEDRMPGGLGISMVRKLMDRMEYRREDGWNILVLEKRR